MTEFNERWDRMTVVERIAHIRADWANCRETDDPMVLFIASAVAHTVCRQAADEIERLRAERDDARREVCAADAAYVRDPDEREPHMLGYAAKRGWDCFKEAGK